MMKRIALVIVSLTAAAAIGYGADPDEFKRYLGLATQILLRVWEGVEANPGPVCLAIGTFLLTVIYHKARGKSLRESVEVAATRVTMVSVPSPAAAENETSVVTRAKARATRTQLLADQIGLENRLRKLPAAIVTAEKEVCYAKQALTEAERTRAERRKAHDEALSKLEAIRKEMASGAAELAEIEAEINKMAALV